MKPCKEGKGECETHDHRWFGKGLCRMLLQEDFVNQ